MKYTDTLKKNYEFRYILTKGTYYGGKYLDSYIVKNNKKTNNIGLAIGVKIAKANKRNKVKRLIRENYRLLEKDLVLGYNIVFLWKKKVSVEQATFYNIKEDMQRIITKAKLLKIER